MLLSSFAHHPGEIGTAAARRSSGCAHLRTGFTALIISEPEQLHNHPGGRISPTGRRFFAKISLLPENYPPISRARGGFHLEISPALPLKYPYIITVQLPEQLRVQIAEFRVQMRWKSLRISLIYGLPEVISPKGRAQAVPVCHSIRARLNPHTASCATMNETGESEACTAKIRGGLIPRCPDSSLRSGGQTVAFRHPERRRSRNRRIFPFPDRACLVSQ